MRMVRREFLQSVAIAGAALGLSPYAWGNTTLRATIERIDTFPLIYPTVGRFKFFEGPKGRATGRPAVLVKITADNGAVGWGQSVPLPKWSYETLETVHTTISKYLAP